ncbi:MAG: amidohydrolase family protein [Rhodothermales bacterium]|nr:amidohydrolase family protein [Rhodothermales bacterium]
MKIQTLAVLALLLPLAAQAQELQWEDYEPRSTLVVETNEVTRAKYPFVDAHAHQWRIGEASAEEIAELVAAMDALNMAVMVNLSGGSGESLQQKVANTEAHAPGRFVHYANIDFSTIDDPDFGTKAAAQLEADVRNGARGLKIFKNLGMYVFYADSSRVRTDDPRLAPIWAKAGELGIPVLIHTGDPAPFWEPHDRHNERWFELKERPRRKRDPEPSWETIMGEHWNLIRRHPETTFISAHLSWLGNDLGRLGRLMDELPNMYTELGAVVAELGRQPHTARQFLIDYQDRVLMGKDSWAPEEYHVYFRTFETADEFFPYYRKRHAWWNLYGLDLPDDVLRKVYYENALAIIPGLDRARFPAN